MGRNQYKAYESYESFRNHCKVERADKLRRKAERVARVAERVQAAKSKSLATQSVDETAK